jgi:hypothetical protein
MILSNERYRVLDLELEAWTLGHLLICCVHSYLYGILLRDCIYGFNSLDLSTNRQQ